MGAAYGKQEGEGQYMPNLSTGTVTTIVLVIGLAVSGCDLYNGNQPSTNTTGGATTGGVTSRGGIGSTSIDGSTTRGGIGDTTGGGMVTGSGVGGMTGGGTGGTTSGARGSSGS